MNVSTKIVALLLLFGLLAGPGLPLSHCLIKTSNGSETRQAHCSMMANMAVSGNSVIAKGVPQAASCCRISPASPRPISALAGSGDLSRGAMGVVEVRGAVISVLMSVHTFDAIPRPPFVHSLALLCTLLI